MILLLLTNIPNCIIPFDPYSIASVYPASIQLHNKTVNMIASMWHAPAPSNGGNYTLREIKHPAHLCKFDTYHNINDI